MVKFFILKIMVAFLNQQKCSFSSAKGRQKRTLVSGKITPYSHLYMVHTWCKTILAKYKQDLRRIRYPEFDAVEEERGEADEEVVVPQ